MNRPLKKFRAGQVSCALWENEIVVNGREMTMLKATFERRYKDKEGNWKNASSFRISDLPRASLVMQKAFEYLVLKEREGNGSAVVEEEIVM